MNLKIFYTTNIEIFHTNKSPMYFSANLHLASFNITPEEAAGLLSFAVAYLADIAAANSCFGGGLGQALIDSNHLAVQCHLLYRLCLAAYFVIIFHFRNLLFFIEGIFLIFLPFVFRF